MFYVIVHMKSYTLIGLLLISLLIITGCGQTTESSITNPAPPQKDRLECTPNWECSEWSGCSTFGAQTRTCTDKNTCGISTDKPSESQSCTRQILEPSPIMLSGTGQEATSKFSLERGISIFEMKHDGTRNFAIVLYDTNGEYINLLVNTIGRFDGSKLSSINTKDEYLLDISADGNWEVEIKQPRPTTGRSVPLTLSGAGQKTSEIFYLNTGITRFKMKHDGNRNFAIVLYNANGEYTDLLVNTIGSFDGSKATSISKAGLYLLDITADGNWEVSIE